MLWIAPAFLDSEAVFLQWCGGTFSRYEFLTAVAEDFKSSKGGLVPHRGLEGFTPRVSETEARKPGGVHTYMCVCVYLLNRSEVTCTEQYFHECMYSLEMEVNLHSWF